MWPYAATALTGLRARLRLMPTYHAHALAIAAGLGGPSRVEVVANLPKPR